MDLRVAWALFSSQARGMPRGSVGHREKSLPWLGRVGRSKENRRGSPALRAAFARPGPTLVDVTIDPSGYGAQLTALRG